jgi:Ca2+-binding RTX toxin-like protein
LALGTPGGEQVLPDDGTDPAKERWGGQAGGTSLGFVGGGKVAALPETEAPLGGTGLDTINVYGSADSVTGGAGNDTINAFGSFDTVNAGAGSDTINVFGASDTVWVPAPRVRRCLFEPSRPIE